MDSNITFNIFISIRSKINIKLLVIGPPDGQFSQNLEHMLSFTWSVIMSISAMVCHPHFMLLAAEN